MYSIFKISRIKLNTIKKFNLDPDSNTDEKILHSAFFVNFSRSQMKDKIKKGTFDLLVNVSGTSNVHLLDSNSAGPTIRECPTGEFGLLFASSNNSGFKTLNNNKIFNL